MNLTDQIRNKIRPNQEYTSSSFLNSVDGNRDQVSQTLSRLARAGELTRKGQGIYTASALPPETRSSQITELRAMETLVNRARLMNSIGMQFDGIRDTWKSLGYRRILTFNDYWERYSRGDVAKRIVDAPAKATWRNAPVVMDDKGKDSAFAVAWLDLEARLKIYHFCERVDRLTGIGRYGVLLIGLTGPNKLSEPALPVDGPDGVLYLSTFHEDAAKIEFFEANTASARFGLPTAYNINLLGDLRTGNPVGDITAKNQIVHWTRVIHVAEDLLNDNVFGTPRMEAIFNKLMDLEKVVGGSAEAVWKIIDRGMALLLDKDASLTPEAEQDINDELERYTHGLQRFLRLQGMEIKNLGGDTADPRGAFAVLSAIISGTTGIPQRVLFGSERGQLASTQDERNFNARIKERMTGFAEPTILMPLIDTFVEVKALPEPEGKVKVVWPDLTSLSDKEMSDIARTQGRAARDLSQTEGMFTVDEKRAIMGFEPLEEELPVDTSEK